MTSKLVKLRLMSSLSRLAGVNAKDGRRSKRSPVLMVAIYAFIAVFFAAFFTLIAAGIAPALIQLGADWFYFLLFIGLDVSLVFIFGIFETKSEIFECKDNELLLSMPIKPFSIVLSRIISVIIWNYIESALIFIPAIVVYAVFGGLLSGIIGGVLLFIFIPLLPTALSALVGFAVSAISARFKKKTFISVVFFLAFFAGYMYGYSALVEGMDSMILNADAFASSVGRFAFLRAIGDAALLKPLPLILIAVAALASVALTVLLISLCFEKIAFYSRGEKKTEYKAKSMTARSTMFSLVKKDLSRFFSSAMYIINSSLGIVFMVLFAGYAVFKIDSLMPIAESFAALFSVNANELVTLALVSVLAVCSALTSISACSLSLEGKSLWIMKSMPIPARDVLLAKVLAQLTVTSVPTLISSVLLMIATGDYALFWYYILIPQGIGIISALVGILWNTAFPKLDFVNETAVIKNSASVFLTMLTLMIVGAALAVMGIWLLIRIPFIAVAFIELGALIFIITALVLVLLKLATVKYDSL